LLRRFAGKELRRYPPSRRFHTARSPPRKLYLGKPAGEDRINRGELHKGKATIERVLMLIHELFTEAVALTEQRVRTIFDKTEGRDWLMWRILLLTGLRPGELLALPKQI
jgi:integrase